MRSEHLRDKSTPAPLDRQPYYERMKALAAKATEYYGGRKPQAESRKTRLAREEKEKKKEKRVEYVIRKGKKVKVERVVEVEVAPPPKPNLNMSEEVAKEGFDMRGIREVDVPLKLYDKNSYSEWKAVVESEADFLSVVPKDDPYRLERDLSIYASGDVRWFGITASEKVLSGDDQRFWLMGADIGVRMRPFDYHKFSAVIEARFLNGPDGEDPEDGFTDHAMAKSAYLLWDDLSYNSFLQWGLYRPMFGHYDPDHNSLSSEVSGLTQDKVFKGFAFGTAPNVPFIVVNYVQPYDKDGGEAATSSGFVVTGGGRFVTMGASIAASYWNTDFQKISDTTKYKRQMYSINGGLTIKDFIFNIETLRAQITSSNQAKKAGNTYTLQTKYRFFRENYLLLNLGNANIARDLTPGKGSDFTVGVKSFPYSNIELEALYVMRKYTENSVNSDYNLTQIQAHIFF